MLKFFIILDKQSYRKPVQVLSFTEDNKIKINDDCLKEIFNHSEVKDREIVVFTIIGAYRKGKSFFLNYCLRYLYAHVSLWFCIEVGFNYSKNSF